jgi:hypothetical protein
VRIPAIKPGRNMSDLPSFVENPGNAFSLHHPRGKTLPPGQPPTANQVRSNCPALFHAAMSEFFIAYWTSSALLLT